MPPKKKRQSAGSADNTLNDSITMPQGALEAILATLQQSQQDFCMQLLSEVRSSTPTAQPDAAAIAAAAAAAAAAAGGATTVSGNLSQCSAHYSGSPEESLENFVDSVEIYKSCLNVSDENALRGFPMLLTHSAALWWQGVKDSTYTWKDALLRLQGAFGERRPPYRIYKQLFSLVQAEENTELFVAKVRALLSRLPIDDLSEKVKLDMTFGLLDRRIRKRVDRDCLNSFDDLLARARNIEDSLKESNVPVREETSLSARNVAGYNSPPAPPPACAAVPESFAAPAAATDHRASTSCFVEKHVTHSSDRPKRLFCVYCKQSGHVVADCKKLKSKSDTTPVISDSDKSDNAIRCYGCGASGVIRSKCPTCNPDTGQAFYSLTASTSNELSAPPLRPPRVDARARSVVIESSQSLRDVTHGARSRMRGNVDVDSSFGANSRAAADGHAHLSPARYVTGVNPSHADECTAVTGNTSLYGVSEHSSEFSKNDCFSDVGNNILSECVVNVQDSEAFRRPILDINVIGERGTGLVDSAAKTCVAGHTLYSVLIEKGHLLTPCTQIVKLADGVSKVLNVFTTRLEVTLKHKTLMVDFLIFPDAKSNETLLGINFLKKFNLVVDFGNANWYFAERSQLKFDLQFESVLSPPSTCAAMDVLRGDGVTLPSGEQREELAHPFIEKQDIIKSVLRSVSPHKKELMRTEECGENRKTQLGMMGPVVINALTRSPRELRRAQLDDPELKKVITVLENSKFVSNNVKRWTGRGYFMQQGVLYKYSPDVGKGEPQLVVPASLRPDILRECHALAGHKGLDRTLHRVSQNFYFPGMRHVIADYVMACASCRQYKPGNEKASGLLQGPILNQREVLVDLFGPFPPREQGEKWILIVEDSATGLVELYDLKEGTSEACARVLIEEYFARYGFSCRIVSSMEGFVPRITPYLRSFLSSLVSVRDQAEIQQDKRKGYVDRSCKAGEVFSIDDEVLDKFHVSQLSRFRNRDDTPPSPEVTRRPGGRPRACVPVVRVHERACSYELEGESVACDLPNNRPL
ncbi:uncharacterized protein LOC126381310 [Pectinophora gossypiella]|uniref:uncharacterized protein LOC126381310 n=1 Tax=Pectinophora gossypiella TaxID=13191 RepID=UPI00214F583E|nr:uncharacterized protein LOC126381310 [Pectinophora gossypiella]